jgi:hypothetical protein
MPDVAAVGVVPRHSRFASYDTSSAARIAVDPATLLPYAREEQIHRYVSLGNGKESLLESEHRMSTTRYVEDQPGHRGP